jgi:hypothetical protein
VYAQEVDMPWVPPYLGSWEQLIQELLHNPFLGSGHSWPPKLRESASTSALVPGALPHPEWQFEPEPVPWRQVAAALAQAVNAKVLAGQIGDKTAHNANQTIVQLLDDYCGTPPRVVPWPWPGPPPWNFAIASELNAAASALPEGAMRAGLQEVAKQVMVKGLAAGQATA